MHGKHAFSVIGVDRRVLDPKYERSEYTAGSGMWGDGDDGKHASEL